MHGTWIGEHGELAVAGAFGDLATHHHPAVQVAVGLGGLLELSTADGVTRCCRGVAIASGTRHALLGAAGVLPISLYLRPDTAPGAGINARTSGGIWLLSESLCDCIATVFESSGVEAAARRLMTELSADVTAAAAHPQVQAAVELVRARPGEPADLVSIAHAVALSPDYLGRLFKRQMGASFSATARWLRLVAALEHLGRGATLTDAAHAAGFTDGAHANRVAWELLGGAPSSLVRALTEPDGSVQAPDRRPAAG